MRTRRQSDDRGFTLVWTATILVVLLGMVGFGTDLGWLYLNTVRAQTAVDSAALAGVVNLPGFDPTPDAVAAAQANGFDPGGVDTLVLKQTADNELEASLSIQVDTFFLGVLGFDHFNVTRTATAQYVKPVPLGSPDNCFGGGNLVSGCSGDADFWAAVSGRRTLVEDGDPFSTQCVRNSWNGSAVVCAGDPAIGPPASINSFYSRESLYSGYYYGVEVVENSTDLRVLVWDRGFQQRSPIGSQTGDSEFGVDGASFGIGPSPQTRYRLYPPDTTALIPYDHLPTPQYPLNSPSNPICTETSPPFPGTINDWNQLCSIIADPVPGIWLVHVETLNNSAGSNNYALRAETDDAPDPRIYGINDMSIWSNDLSAASELYLAEVGPEHAGKKLELKFYDPGDAVGQSWYSLLDPFGATPTCSWTVWNYNESTPVPSLDGSGPCEWLTSIAGQNDGVYNEMWISVIIDLPTDPALMCEDYMLPTQNCFWTMDLDLAEPTERTVWRARVIGNPVRLLP